MFGHGTVFSQWPWWGRWGWWGCIFIRTFPSKCLWIGFLFCQSALPSECSLIKWPLVSAISSQNGLFLGFCGIRLVFRQDGGQSSLLTLAFQYYDLLSEWPFKHMVIFIGMMWDQDWGFYQRHLSSEWSLIRAYFYHGGLYYKSLSNLPQRNFNRKRRKKEEEEKRGKKEDGLLLGCYFNKRVL